MILEDVAYESINANSPAEEEDDAGCFSPRPLLGAQRDPRGQPVLRLDRRVASAARTPRRACAACRGTGRWPSRARSPSRARRSRPPACAASRSQTPPCARSRGRTSTARTRACTSGCARRSSSRARARGVAWASHDCGEELALADDADDGACARCQAASLASVSFAVLALVTSLPNVRADLGRSTRRGDTNCAKATAIATGVVSTASSLSSLALYDRSCHRAVAHSRAGLGLVCVAVAVGLKPVNVLFHALLRTPREKHRRLLRWRPLGRADSDNGVTVASMTGPALI